MSNFIELEYIYMNFNATDSDTIIEKQWVNLDHISNYHSPSRRLVFSDAESSQLTLTDKGHTQITNRLNMQADEVDT